MIVCLNLLTKSHSVVRQFDRSWIRQNSLFDDGLLEILTLCTFTCQCCTNRRPVVVSYQLVLKCRQIFRFVHFYMVPSQLHHNRACLLLIFGTRLMAFWANCSAANAHSISWLKVFPFGSSRNSLTAQLWVVVTKFCSSQALFKLRCPVGNRFISKRFLLLCWLPASIFRLP